MPRWSLLSLSVLVAACTASVVAPDAVVVRDGPAPCRDRVARRRLDAAPLAERVLGVLPGEEREVERGARRIDMRHVAGDERRVPPERLARLYAEAR